MDYFRSYKSHREFFIHKIMFYFASFSFDFLGFLNIYLKSLRACVYFAVNFAKIRISLFS